MAEANPDALVIPTVLFTGGKRWRKAVPKVIDHQFGNRCFLHFEYIFVKLFDFIAKDHYNSVNPLVRILLPKMDYPEAERGEVFRYALTGLFQLTTALMFEKYTEFIDLYSGLQDEEREIIYQELRADQETAMITQYIKEKGIQEGIHQGLLEGIELAIHLRFGAKGAQLASDIQGIEDIKVLRRIKEALMTAKTPEEIKALIEH